MNSFSVVSKTPLLYSDFTWRSIDDVCKGDEIISFEENPVFGISSMSSRRFKVGKVLSKGKGSSQCVRITCGNGVLDCSENHPLLVWGSRQLRDDFYNKPSKQYIESLGVVLPRGKGLIWKKAKDVSIGEQIAYMCEPWLDDYNNFDVGWLSGIYDGEGTLCRGKSAKKWLSCCKISFSQNEGIVLDKCRSILDRYGFSYYENPTSSGCMRNTLTGGVIEYMRFLGIFRPYRLISKLENYLDELPVFKRNTSFVLLPVSNIEPIGEKEVVTLKTSNGTMVANGFLVHDST